MESMLDFVYTNSCDLLREGKLVPSPKPATSNKKNSTSKKGRQTQSPEVENLILQVREASKRFGLKLLSERFQDFCVVGGRLKSAVDSALPRMEFERESLLEYCDVWLQSEEGVEFPCHKCILVARLEYFEHMLQIPLWIEGSGRSPIQLPMTARVLALLLDYLYTNKGDKLYESEDIEFLCQTLVVADQLLIPRLKEMCEVALVDLVTLKNACELLELSHVYNARQLRATCQQYILINLPAFLESGPLEVLSDEALESLTRAYRCLVPGMSKRRLSMDPGLSPTREELERLNSVFQPPDPEQDLTAGLDLASKGSSRSATKKKGRQRRVSEKSDDEKMLQQEMVPCVKADSPKQSPVVPRLPPTPEKVVESTPPKVPSNGRVLKPWKPVQTKVELPTLPQLELGLKEIMLNEKELIKSPPWLTTLSHPVQLASGPKGGIKKLSQRERKALTAASNSTEPLDIPTRNQSSSAWGQTSPPNAWNMQSSSLLCTSPIASPPAEVPKLEEILQEESLKTTRTNIQPKALHLINLEDKAMEELLLLYSAAGNPEERITVVRVPSAVPVPAVQRASLSKWNKRLI